MQSFTYLNNFLSFFRLFSNYLKNSWLILSGSGTIYYKSFCILLFRALECFCQAASEVGKEEFLDRLISSEDGEIVSTPAACMTRFWHGLVSFLHHTG